MMKSRENGLNKTKQRGLTYLKPLGSYTQEIIIVSLVLNLKFVMNFDGQQEEKNFLHGHAKSIFSGLYRGKISMMVHFGFY